MTAKAIETRYKGWRFRSRLEARWAVFLEAAGIRFEYEAEGFALPSGPYLPDFKLTGFASDLPEDHTPEVIWLEVKPTEATDAEWRKCAELSVAVSEPVLLVEGAPDFGPQVYLFDVAGHLNAGVEPTVMAELVPRLIGPLTFLEVKDSGRSLIGVGRSARPEQGPLGNPDFERAWEMFAGPFVRILGAKDARFLNSDCPVRSFRLSDRLKAAYDKARGARFEFGQSEPRWPS